MPRALLQRRASAPAPGHVPESVREVLRQPGQPLPAQTRRTMEARFGHDFSRVRIHTDATAIRSAQEIGAEAWTVGRDIAFGADRWHPETATGRRLLAHELTHVVQQHGAAISPGATLSISDVGEREASAAEMAVPPVGATSHAAGPSVRRKTETPLRITDFVPSRAQMETMLDLAPRVRDAIEQQSDGLLDMLSSLQGWGTKRKFMQVYAVHARSGYSNSDLRRDIIEMFPRRRLLVDALALLHDAKDLHAPHVDLARDIIPDKVADDHAYNLLLKRSLPERRRLEEEYNATFWGMQKELYSEGCPTTEDGLLMHLHRGLRPLKLPWRFQKCWALLDRELTAADDIYFDSVGIPDAHRDALAGHFLKVYRRDGFEGIERLYQSWGGYIQSSVMWNHYPPPQPWHKQGLYSSMKSEVGWSPQTWQTISAILDEYDDRTHALDKARHQSDVNLGDEADEETRRHLRVEQKIAGAHKGWLDFTTSPERLLAAARRVRELHQERLAGLRPGSDARKAAQARYEQDRAGLLSGIRRQWVADTGTYDAVQSALSLDLAGTKADFNFADEFYAARDDYEQLVTLATKYWLQNRIRELWQQAGEARIYGDRQHPQGERPAFRPDQLLPRQYVTPFLRYTAMVALDGARPREQLKSGAERLQVELVWARSGSHPDSALGEIVKFFGTPGFSPALRARVVQAWEEKHPRAAAVAEAGKTPGDSPVRRFLAQMEKEFEGKANNWLDLADLLDPVDARSSPEKAAGRAGLRRQALKRHWANPGSFMRAAYDDLTGENLFQHVEDNAARLQFIADNYHTNKEALAVMLRVSGGTVEELAAQNFHLSEEQARDLKDMQNTCTDMFVSALETVAELVAGAMTGGATLAPLIKSLAVSMAGMGLREMLMGEDYQLLSGANFKSLVNTSLSFAFLRVDTRKMVADRWSNKTMPGVGRLYEGHKNAGKVLAGFVQCGAQKFVETGVSNTVNVALDSLIFDKAIRPKDIANLGANMLVSILAGGAAGGAVVNHHPGLIHALTDPATLTKEALLFRGGLALNSVGKQVSLALQTGGDRTIFEIMGTATTALSKTVATTFLSAPFDAIDMRREMQKAVRLALEVAKDPRQVEGLSKTFVDADRKKAYSRLGGEVKVTRDAHERDLKTQREYEALVKKSTEDKVPPPTYTQFLADRAVKQGEWADVVDALKPGMQALNNDTTVRSGPIWEANRGGKLEDLQGVLRAQIEQWQSLAGDSAK